MVFFFMLMNNVVFRKGYIFTVFFTLMNDIVFKEDAH